jgi:uncharacterized membrane protein YgdD (TMEM256/DUF423 family)
VRECLADNSADGFQQIGIVERIRVDARRRVAFADAAQCVGEVFMHRTLMAAATGGFLAVAIGAFATHGLHDILDRQALAWIETGVRYQAWHSLALLAVAALMAVRPDRALSVAAGATVLGMVMFSGSLYGMALKRLAQLRL